MSEAIVHPSTARALTALEVQDRLLTTAINIADEYANDDDLSATDKCHGVAFSLLAALDGTRDLPPMDLVTRPSQDVIDINIEQGEDYIPAGLVVNTGYDMHKRYDLIRKEVASDIADDVEEGGDQSGIDDDEIPF